jgi:hypothetical protein
MTNLNPDHGLYKKYFSKKSILRFAGIALIIRSIILGYFIYQSHQLFPDRLVDGFIFKMNDYEYFLGTIDNYFEKGTMTYLDQSKPFAGRMPGYGFPYLLIRFFSSQQAGLAILTGLQIILGSLATYCLALLALMIFNDTRIFKTVFWSFAICAPVVVFDIFTLAESFAVSAIVFFNFFLFRYCSEGKINHLLLAGFFMAWAIFLRPFLGTMLLAAPLFLLLFLIKKETAARTVTTVFLFLLPFFVFETAWIIRNFTALNRFIPLETSLSESYGEDGAYRTSAIGIRTMINAWGGETGEFYEGSEDWWFHHAEGDGIAGYNFKPYVFNSSFSRDSLVLLKNNFNSSVNPHLSPSSRDSLNMLANQTALRFAADYRKNNPLRYYLLNPLKRYGRLLFSNGTRLLILPAFSNMSLLQKVIKLSFILLYYGIIAAGSAGMVLFLFKEKPYPGSSLLTLAFPWIVATTLVFYSSFVIIEYRYLLPALPIFLLFGVYCFFNLPFLKKTTIQTFPVDQL